MQVQQSKDPDGLRVFYYLVQVGFCELSFRSSQTMWHIDPVACADISAGPEVHGVLLDECALQDTANPEMMQTTGQRQSAQ